jgi:hypothetical protein
VKPRVFVDDSPLICIVICCVRSVGRRVSVQLFCGCKFLLYECDNLSASLVVMSLSVSDGGGLRTFCTGSVRNIVPLTCEEGQCTGGMVKACAEMIIIKRK